MNITINNNAIVDMWLQFQMDSFGRHLAYAIVVAYQDDIASQLKFPHNVCMHELRQKLQNLENLQDLDRKEVEDKILEIAYNLFKEYNLK